MNRKFIGIALEISMLTMLPLFMFAQELSRSSADEFLSVLFQRAGDVSVFADDSALAVSNRLGIAYEGVPSKILISYDFDEGVKARVRKGESHYSSSLISCGPDYQRLSVTIDAPNVTKEFYFRHGRLTSPFFYHTADWQWVETKFFRVYFRDTSLINVYSMETLDRFAADMSSMLGFSDEDMEILNRQKILYYLCKDEDEIERLTGYRTRGMYNLAYDAVISTYNAHCHELAHLLINFKIRNAQMYCNPFLQEGFAVAVGGRGGLSPDVVAALGSYLDESKMLHYTELLTKDGFNAVDPSMSYPVAGLYNEFLLKSLGDEEYLELYRRHCGKSGDSAVQTIAESELPSANEWASFLDKYRKRETIRLDAAPPEEPPIYGNDTAAVYRCGDDYLFMLRRAMPLGKGAVEWGYWSRKFTELLPKTPYRRYKYLVTADSQSVSVYNLLTDNLIANYVASFSIPPKAVPVDSGMHCFVIPASVFDEPLESLLSDRSKSRFDSMFVQHHDYEISYPPESRGIWIGGGYSQSLGPTKDVSLLRQYSLVLGGYADRHIFRQFSLSYLYMRVPEQPKDDFATKTGISVLQASIDTRFYSPSSNAWYGHYFDFGFGLVAGMGRYADSLSVPEQAGSTYFVPGLDIHCGVGFTFGRLKPISTTIQISPALIGWFPTADDPGPLPPSYFSLTLKMEMNFSFAGLRKYYSKIY